MIKKASGSRVNDFERIKKGFERGLFSYAFSHAGYLILVIIYDKIINTKGKP